MKITHTEIYRFSIPMIPFVIATGTMHFAQNVFIRVYTDEGIYGVGECSAFPMIVGETQETCLAMARDFAAIWKGKDALDMKARMKDLDNFTSHNHTIKSAFDLALYDIASKAENKPLYKYLGGEKKPVETDITIGIGSVNEMVAAALKFKANGASLLKVKLGKNVHDDVSRIKAIRNAVGTEIIIRIDANQGWTFEEALQALQAMEDVNIQFCEQPMRTWHDDLLPELRRKSPVKIMADESCFNHHDARKQINSGSCDYINIKFSKSGGIAEALKIHQVATEAGIPCMMGGMLESRIALSAKLHLVYACPNIQFYDLDTCMIGHLIDPVIGGVEYKGYFLDLPDKPGIGADADENFLKDCEKWII
ncbi:mandelate racemase/muconate lactonizing enzyme family protein [Daejeonella oryzae]|uniref:mandelate racemase/muconate lactonizing enzyme family protein n=1 Tax=Daejeonella oryzae TaxID=1122943 RepID=UPI00047EAD82|nr:dipeptide epimerase [Daejeonella oryzae]